MDSGLGAFLHVDPERVRAEARAVDARVAAGEDPGPLAGVPVAIKDNLTVAGMPTTCASRILETYRPPYTATAVTRLRAAGAVVLGKTNMDEFGMGSSNENSAFFPTRNPHDRERVPGGSSGGSAAAVASGMAPLAVGSDTGGSIRQPGAFCGLPALKPTYGRVSRFGLVAFASSLDQVGGFARSVDDLHALYLAMAGHDPRDGTSADRPVEAAAGDSVEGLRVGLVDRFLDRPGMDPLLGERVRDAAAALGEQGASVRSVTLPDPEAAVAAYYLVATSEASSNLARYDGVRYGFRAPATELQAMYRETRSAGFGAEVKRRILLGTYALSSGYYDAYYGRAETGRAAFAASLDRVFADVDLLLLPTTPTTAFRLGEHATDPLTMYLSDVFTVLANLVGLPAMNVPAGLDASGLPVGVQLMGRAWEESTLLRAARVLEQVPALRVPLPSGEDA